jgi:hypothetical protein
MMTTSKSPVAAIAEVPADAAEAADAARNRRRLSIVI